MYIISNYAELYNPTNTKGGELINAQYVKMPIKPRGKGLRALLRQEKGLEIFGIWTLLLQAATETTTPALRGKFLNHKDEPASIEEIADAISLESKVDLVKDALAQLTALRWIESVPDADEVRIESVPDADEVRPKVKVKKSEDNSSKDKEKPLDFTSERPYNFKKLFFDEFDPVSQYEKNTLSKLAKDYGEKHNGLKHADKYMIDKIRDLKLMCKEQKKNRLDLIKIFVSQIKKELK